MFVLNGCVANDCCFQLMLDRNRDRSLFHTQLRAVPGRSRHAPADMGGMARLLMWC